VILCHCAVVSDRDVKACVDAGARTVGQVLRATGAGRDCGGCTLAVRACAVEAICQARRTDHLEVLDATG
jgi:bacterioferritin-associated ferredoxin